MLYKALVAALKEATEIVNKDKVAAAALWIEDSKSKIAARYGRQDRCRTAGALDHDARKHHEIRGLHGRGRTLKTKPGSWKDYFFPEIHDEKGS